MSRIYDISQTLATDTPVWPGDTPFQIAPNWKMEGGCPVLVSRLTLSTHSGSHADAPSHYVPDGSHMAEAALHPYLGPCHVVRAQAGDGPVTLADIETDLEALEEVPERLLVRTFDHFPHERWPTGFRAIDADLIRYLGQNGCVLIGTDTPSLDPETAKILKAHAAIADMKMAILEGLVLDDVPVGLYELVALPLKIQHADASPVRAILRTYPDDS